MFITSVSAVLSRSFLTRSVSCHPTLATAAAQQQCRRVNIWPRSFRSIQTAAAARQEDFDVPSSAKHSDIPVGIFWDLDNVRPEVLSRKEVEAYTQPLSALASAVGQLSRFAAFANQDTFAYVSPSERLRQKEMDELDMDEYDMSRNISGWDEEVQALRCGVCGSKHSSHAKLEKHFKNLHGREAKKVKARLSQIKKKGGAAKQKLHDRLSKYRAGAVDVVFTSDIAESKPSSSKSSLRQVLKEAGVKCYSVPKKENAADTKLMSDAGTFLGKLGPPSSSSGSHTAAADDDNGEGTLRRPFRAVLVLVSGDSDYVPLVQRCRQLKVAAVLAHCAPGSEDLLYQPAGSGVSQRLMELSDGYLNIETQEFSPLTEYGRLLSLSLKGSTIRIAPHANG